MSDAVALAFAERFGLNLDDVEAVGGALQAIRLWDTRAVSITTGLHALRRIRSSLGADQFADFYSRMRSEADDRWGTWQSNRPIK